MGVYRSPAGTGCTCFRCAICAICGNVSITLGCLKHDTWNQFPNVLKPPAQHFGFLKNGIQISNIKADHLELT